MNVSIRDVMSNVVSSTPSVATRRLCVVSRNPVMSGVFIAGLTTSVGSRDELEIIVDRRQRGSITTQPTTERRQRDHVARALERDGFAVVSMPAATLAGSGPKRDSWPVEHVAPEETYEHKLERLLWFKQGRLVRLGRWLVLSALMNAILVMFFVLPAVKARVMQSPRAASPSSIVTPAQPVGERESSLPAAQPQP